METDKPVIQSITINDADRDEFNKAINKIRELAFKTLSPEWMFIVNGHIKIEIAGCRIE